MKYTDGYKVDLAAFNKMHDTIRKLLDEEFGRDYDNDSNVEFILIDRQRYRRPHFFLEPYDDLDNSDAIDKGLSIALHNISVALESFEQLNRLRIWMNLEKKRKVEGHVFKPGQGQLSYSHKYCSVVGCNELEKEAIHHRGEIQVPGGVWVKLNKEEK